MWRPTRHDEATLASYAETQATAGISATFCHATYLINLATADGELLEKSSACLLENLLVTTAIGAGGLVLHVGSHRGAGLAGTEGQVADALLGALEETEKQLARPSAPILLENAAGAGGTVGRTLEELAALIAAADGDAHIGMCLDTQHLFASGIDYSTLEAADAVVAALDTTIGLERLRALHLNDSKVPLGANRDRHENLGEGQIGADALGFLISSPRLDHVAALLEVPGEGDGPRAEDVAKANAILAAGKAARG
jgi:deoxyribonuclease IV